MISSEIDNLFILAHPDDELMALPILLESKAKNYFIFLTSGVSENCKPDLRSVRRHEVTVFFNYLSQAGVNVELLELPDAVIANDSKLGVEFSEPMWNELVILLKRIQNPFQIISTAFEGAHQDHDAAAVISNQLATNFRCSIYFYSTYRHLRRSKHLFHLMNPTDPSTCLNFRRMRALKFGIKGVFVYKSQCKTWIGLGPLLILKFIFAKWRYQEKMNFDSRSIPDATFYELRKRSTVRHEYGYLQRILLLTNNFPQELQGGDLCD